MDSLVGRIAAVAAGQDASGGEALVAIAAGQNLSKRVGHFKSYTARSIIDELDQRGFAPVRSQGAWERAIERAVCRLV